MTFSGAGLSVESGIPTFRASDGLWNDHKIEEVADHKAWYGKTDHQVVLDFYAARWQNIQDCEPNEGHKALAKLQEKYEVTNITQNIDDLLERAGCKNVIHLHGSINSRKCEFHQNTVFQPFAPSGVIRGSFKCDFKQKHSDGPIKAGEVCPKCGGNLRPDVVWFGESVNMMEDYFNTLAEHTDVFIGIGTSAQVQPAASLLFTFRNVKEKYFIDPNPPLRSQSFNRLAGKATEHLPKVVDDLLSRDD